MTKDLISREDAIKAVEQEYKIDKGYMADDYTYGFNQAIKYVSDIILQDLPSAETVQGVGRYENAMQKLREMPLVLNGVKAKQIKKISAEAEWIPFKKRPLTDEEKQEYPDWAYIFDCLLPDDEEEILLSNGKHVWTDMFINDGECYLDGGDDIDDGMAWMPLPKPYKGGDEE